MAQDKKTCNDIPTSYIYRAKDGKYYRSDKDLTAKINRHVFRSGDFEQAGAAFYPQWPEPEFKSQTRPAWFLDRDGIRKVRWRWAEIPHQKSHYACERISDTICKVQIPLQLGWDDRTKMWTICEPRVRTIDNPKSKDKK